MQPVDTVATAPAVLTESQTSSGTPIVGTSGGSAAQNSYNVTAASNTSSASDRVTVAAHEATANDHPAEEPARMVNVVRQILPVREIVLPSDRVIQAATLELHPGMRLAPAAGSRAQVQVPAGGWQIDIDDLRLENIDFVLAEQGEVEAPAQTFINLKATKAQFHGCSFRLAEGQDSAGGIRHSAISWVGVPRGESIDRLPAAGHLLLANCFLSNIHTGIDCRLAGPMLLELDNVLFVAPSEAANSGALWRLDHAPANEDTFVLRMNACTVRDAMSLVDIYCAELPAEPGKVNLETIDCVFSLRSTGALLRTIGPYRPDRLLRSVAWGGRGSLLPIQGRFGLWYDAQGSPHAIDDSGVAIDGLVRGGVEFAGSGNSSPQDSVLTHWAAPLIGDNRPGVRVSALPGEIRH